MKESKIDCDYTSDIICPYCGYKFRDSWEVDFGSMEGVVEEICDKCENTFTVGRNVEVTYSSSKIK